MAQPFNPSLLGQSLLETHDVNGKYMTREMVELAKNKGSGWVDYLFKNPDTSEIAPKSSYVELAEEVIVLTKLHFR